MSTSAVFFPFDLFGSGGTAAGADLLNDAVVEMLADNRREQLPTRANAYAGQVKVRQVHFETAPAYQNWRSRGRQTARRALDRGDFLVWVAGNHLGVLPVYDELSRLQAAGRQVLVVQFDAHLDIYNLSDCTTELSHGNFLLHASGPLPPLVNVGTRELLLLPDYVAETYRATFSAADLAIDPIPTLEYLRKAAAAADLVFLDLDCDVLDPTFFPAVTHPLPFGVTPALLLRLLDAVWSPNVVGVAISEFCPARDRDDHSLALLVWLIEYLLLRRYEAGGAPHPSRKRGAASSDGR